MVKILQSQGHLQIAARICEKILETSPGHPRLRSLLETLRGVGRESSSRVEKVIEETEDVTDPGTPLETLQAQEGDLPVPEDPEEAARREKLEKLHGLLRKIQERS
jgi:hypothetical protein